MTIGARLSALWASAQYIIILAGLLLLSIGGNLWQLKRAWTAPLRAENAELEAAAATSLQLAQDGQTRERKLLDAADITAGTLQQAGKEYRQAIANRPLAPQCAPGKERVDAVNGVLGPSEPVIGDSSP